MNTPTHFLDQTATIYPGTATTGAGNESKTTYSANAATIRCRLFPVTGSEAMQYMRDTGRVQYKLLLAPTDSAGTAVALTQAAQVEVGGVRYQLDAPAFGRRPGNQSDVLIRATCFRET